MHIIASVQARLGSSRLPGKVLYQLGDRRLLQWSIDRTEAAKKVDETVVTTGDQPENDAIGEYCDRARVNYLTGTEDDLLARHRAVAEKTDCDILVRITADCPFVPSTEIDRVIEEHLANDARYTTNSTDKMPIGTAVDVIDPDVLVELGDVGETHPVKLPRADPEQWQTIWNDNPTWHAVSDAHIAVDTPADYWSLTDALNAVGDNPFEIAKWITQ